VREESWFDLTPHREMLCCVQMANTSRELARLACWAVAADREGAYPHAWQWEEISQDFGAAFLLAAQRDMRRGRL
jgi:hypothetical protein